MACQSVCCPAATKQGAKRATTHCGDGHDRVDCEVPLDGATDHVDDLMLSHVCLWTMCRQGRRSGFKSGGGDAAINVQRNNKAFLVYMPRTFR